MSLARWTSFVFALVAFFAAVPLARADDAKGIAVVGADGATDATWPLAAAVYGDAALRPKAIDDPTARVLAGEAAAPESSADLKSLAELRGGVKGDDAASREVLAAIAQRLSVRAVAVVFAGTPPGATPYARVYDAASRAFDAARYVPDPGEHVAWTSALRSIQRPYAPQTTVAPVAAVHATAPLTAPKVVKSKAFYESPWFWVAVGAAALLGAGVLIATNVQSGDTIHLQMRFP